MQVFRFPQLDEVGFVVRINSSQALYVEKKKDIKRKQKLKPLRSSRNAALPISTEPVELFSFIPNMYSKTILVLHLTAIWQLTMPLISLPLLLIAV